MSRRLLAALTALALLISPVAATWSIVVVNRRTGEVGVASATCISNTNLLRGLPAVVVGKGGAVMQALSGGEANLVLIFDGLLNDELPADLLNQVSLVDPNFQSRQIGIVGLTGSPVTFTGSNASQAKFGVVGEVGDLAYAIQGNILVAKSVVTDAENALLSSPGDLGQRLLAAMMAARDRGGDGRCSCSLSLPTSCGAPPPAPFKSAHCGFMIVARMGDTDAPCTNGFDCAIGDYYMRLNIRGLNTQIGDPDPVDQLEERYAEWRGNRIGRPDGILSIVDSVDSLPADGTTVRTVTVRLADLEGTPLATGGATVEVTTADGSPSIATVGPVIDNGDGSYAFTLTAGSSLGTDVFAIKATDDLVTATLYPYLEVRSDPARLLTAGYDSVSAAAGETIPMVVRDETAASRRYVVLGSLSGTKGLLFADPILQLPLTEDAFYRFTLTHANTPGLLEETKGILSSSGRAEPRVVIAPGQLLPLAGTTMYWAAVTDGGKGTGISQPIAIEILP